MIVLLNIFKYKFIKSVMRSIGVDNLHKDSYTIIPGRFNKNQLLKLCSPEEYELIIKSYVKDILSEKYSKVVRLGGSGDKGRDVVAYVNDEVWDNYQCKHYKDPLTPYDIWVEIGKLCYYTHIGDFTVPRKYYFVSPCGVGTKLWDLLKNKKNLEKA